MGAFILLLIFMALFTIAAIIVFVFGIIKIWQKITKPHIEAMMIKDQQIINNQYQQYYNQNSNQQKNTSDISSNELKLIEKYRQLSDRSKQTLYDYADTLVRREEQHR